MKKSPETINIKPGEFQNLSIDGQLDITVSAIANNSNQMEKIIVQIIRAGAGNPWKLKLEHFGDCPQVGVNVFEAIVVAEKN